MYTITYMFINFFHKIFSRKKHAWYHLFSASLIIFYWWWLWNILDFLFLWQELTFQQIGILLSVILLSVIILLLFDFDLSDL